MTGHLTRRRAALALGCAGLFCAGPELAHLLAWTTQPLPAPGPSCVVLVLGAAAPALQERRVAAGARALREAGCALMVVSGGSPHSQEPEADGMARIARRLGVVEPALVLERTSRNTWENVGNSLPLLQGFDRTYVISDALHARRGLRYLCRRAPERCGQARPYGHYRFLEAPPAQWLAAWHELGAYVRYR